MTKYHVLQHVDHAPNEIGGNMASWAMWATDVEAASAEEAIRRTVTDAGTYVAVPARSWKPRTVQAVQTTTITLGDPS